MRTWKSPLQRRPNRRHLRRTNSFAARVAGHGSLLSGRCGLTPGWPLSVPRSVWLSLQRNERSRVRAKEFFHAKAQRSRKGAKEEYREGSFILSLRLCATFAPLREKLLLSFA